MLKEPEADVHAANENGTTLLHYAAMFGKAEVLSMLLNKGANPNIGNNRNTTALHKAAQRGELKCLQILIQAGASINAQDEASGTPLHRAINELGEFNGTEKGTKIIKCITELVNRKAKLNLSDDDGCLPFDLVAKHGISELIDLFEKHGADLHHRSRSGYRPIHWAAQGGHVSCVSKLISLGEKVDEDSSEESGNLGTNACNR